MNSLGITAPLLISLSLLITGCVNNSQTSNLIQKPGATEAEQTNHVPQNTDKVSIPQEYSNAEALKPEATPYKLANLILGGTKIPVELKEELKDNKISWIWLTQNTEIEKEVYISTPQNFSLSAGPAESFNPAIPLLKFPFKVGDSYTYKGAQTYGKVKRDATAKITSTNDILNTEMGVFETVLVTIDLNVASGSPGGTNSSFKFWFSPGKGIIKREFGFNSSRLPRKDETKNPEE